MPSGRAQEDETIHKLLYSQGNHTRLSSVRDMILKWAGLKGQQFVDVFINPSALLVPLLLLAAGVGFLVLFFDGESFLLMKYNQYRITQARDEQVEVKQDPSMRGCSQKRVGQYRYEQ